MKASGNLAVHFTAANGGGVVADRRADRFAKASLPRDQELIYPPVQEFWDAAVEGTP